MELVEHGDNMPEIMNKIVKLKNKNRMLRWDNEELMEEKK